MRTIIAIVVLLSFTYTLNAGVGSLMESIEKRNSQVVVAMSELEK
jgi:hypothetical protein